MPPDQRCTNGTAPFRQPIVVREPYAPGPRFTAEPRAGMFKRLTHSLQVMQYRRYRLVKFTSAIVGPVIEELRPHVGIAEHVRQIRTRLLPFLVLLRYPFALTGERAAPT